MADDVDYERELQDQLAEQRRALSEILSALSSESSDELQEMKTMLEEAITDLEAALLDVKKAKLLAACSVLQGDAEQPHAADSIEIQASGMRHGGIQGSGLVAGSQCRFLHGDGRWYSGQVISMSEDGNAEVAFSCPTRQYMLENITLPLGCLRPRRTPSAFKAASAIEPGRVVYAQLPASTAGGMPGDTSSCSRLWQQVEVTAVDELQGTAIVAMQGQEAVTLPIDDLMAQPWLLDSDLDNCSDDDGDEDDGDVSLSSEAEAGVEEEEEEEDHTGLGLDVFGHARLAAQAGPQTDTAHFADWEAHSRGIASKLLAGMGYIKGAGLGRLGLGSATPLEVQMLPQRGGLGSAPKHGQGRSNDGEHGLKRKKKRGGERSRRKKHAADARQGREAKRQEQHQAELQGGPAAAGLFSFINSQLGDKSEAAAKIKAVEVAMLRGIQPQPGKGCFGTQPSVQQQARQKQEDRHSLMKQADKVAACQAKVEHFKSMLDRNSSNRQLAKQIQTTLDEAKSELAAAQAEHARMRQTVTGKEAQTKFWGKF